MSRAELTFACMKQAYDCGINFFDTAERQVFILGYIRIRVSKNETTVTRVDSPRS